MSYVRAVATHDPWNYRSNSKEEFEGSGKRISSVAEEDLADLEVPYKACGQIAALIMTDFVDMLSLALGCMLEKSCLVELTEQRVSGVAMVILFSNF